MRKVVDSNCLQTDLLRDYLSSACNEVVIADPVSIEAHASNIYKSLEVLSDYHSQVIILKRTQQVLKLQCNGDQCQEQLIDFDQTNEFKNYCYLLNEGRKGDDFIRSQLKKIQQESMIEKSRTEKEASNIPQQILNGFSKLTKSEKQILRQSDFPYRDDMDHKINMDIDKLTKELYEGISMNTMMQSKAQRQWSFLYRNAVCSYFFALWRYLRGGLEDITAYKIRNDMVDMQIVTYATYFDGLLSNDKNAVKLYNQARKYIEFNMKA